MGTEDRVKAGWVSSFRELCEYLEDQGVSYTADERKQSVALRLRAGAAAEPLRVCWGRHRKVVSILQVMMTDVPLGQHGAVERAVELLNLACREPGFYMRPQEGMVFFRLEVTRDGHGRVSVSELSRTLRTAAIAALEYTPLLEKLAGGERKAGVRLVATLGITPALA